MRATREAPLLCGEVCNVTDDCGGGPKCGLCPLSRFLSDETHRLPEITEVAANEIPQPQRRLLDHERDMTSTLEGFHGRRTSLRVLRQSTSDDVHHREVLLTLDGTDLAVEFGAISIQLATLPALLRRDVLRADRPLGGLLHDHGVGYVSRPKAFIRVEADALFSRMLGLNAPSTLYGRCNALFTPDERILADIVEILPP